MAVEQITVKEFLSMPAEIEQKIKSLELKKQALVTMAENITSTLNTSPGGGTPEAHRMEKLLAEAADLDKRIKKLRLMQIDAKKDILDTIEKLENPLQQTVLIMKYLDFKTRSRIAIDLKYSLHYINVIESQGILNLQALLDKGLILDSPQ